MLNLPKLSKLFAYSILVHIRKCEVTVNSKGVVMKILRQRRYVNRRFLSIDRSSSQRPAINLAINFPVAYDVNVTQGLIVLLST